MTAEYMPLAPSEKNGQHSMNMGAIATHYSKRRDEHMWSSFRDVEEETHCRRRTMKMGSDTHSERMPVSTRGTNSIILKPTEAGGREMGSLAFHSTNMEESNHPRPSDAEEAEVKPLVFPEGSIELDHTDITLSTCTAVIRFDIRHEPGFFYEVYFRDSSSRCVF